MKWGMFRGLCLGLSIFLTHCTVFPEETTASTHYQTQQEEYYNLLNTMLDTALEQTQKITSCLDDLVIYLNRGNIRAENPQHSRELIFSLKRSIAEMSSPQHFNPISEKKIHALLIMNDACITNINNAIDAKLNELFRPQPEDLCTRSLDLSLSSIHDKLLENEERIIYLKHKVQNAGLTFINKTYRLLESYNNRFGILSKTFKLGCFGCVGLLGLYMLPHETFEKFKLSENNPLTKLKNLLGEKAPMVQFGNDILIDSYKGENSGLARTLEDTLGRAGVTYTGLGVTFALKDFLAEPCKRFIQHQYESIQNTLYNAHEYLRGSNIKHLAKDESEIIDYSQIDSNLVGLDWAKKEIENAISYICDPDRYNRYGIPIPKGFLFTGPPGTGKTEFARWICAEINHRLEQQGITDRDRKAGFESIAWWQIVGGNGIKDVLEKGEKKPRIVFIDEIDTIGLQRDRASQLLNEVLQELSGINDVRDAKSKIIFIGATNKPEHIDPAMRRSGRLGKEIFFPLPDFEKRLAFFEHQRTLFAIDPQNFDSTFLAKQTTGRSFADLKEISSTAALNAKREERPLTQRHFQTAIDRLNGITTAKTLTENQKTILSVYIAGRVTAHLLLDCHEVTSATILPRIRKIKEQNVWNKLATDYVAHERISFGKIFIFDPQEELSLTNEDDLKKEIQTLLAGHIAEEIIHGKAYFSHHKKDKNKALERAMKIQLRGLNFQHLPKKMQDQYALDAQKIIEECESTIKQQLITHKDLVQALSDKLLQESTLYGNDIQNIYHLYILD